MIAKYNNHYFNISMVRVPTRIWRYDHVEGFNKKTKENGLEVYEKYIELSDADEIFEIGFSVNFDGEWCGVFFSEEKNLLSLHTGNSLFAAAHAMEMLERGAYSCPKNADDFAEYRVWKRDFITKQETYTMVSFEEFKQLWKQFKVDLMPPRNNK